MVLLEDTGIWVLISFLIFAAFAWRYGKDIFLGKLDSRIEEIRKEIDTAESLRVEAQELVAQYQRKQRDAAKEAEKIIANAKKHAEEIQKQAEEELAETAKRREQQLQQRLERMEESAIQEIRAHAAQLAVQATAEIIADKMDKATNDRLVEDSIEQVSARL